MTELRETAAALAAWACDNRKVNDPVYRMVTEGRDPGPVYSSCGDLAHWLLYTLGCRHQCINRKEHLGYMIGRNVSRLANVAEAVKPTTAEEYAALDLQPGDILIKWTRPDTRDAHVFVFDRLDGDKLHSWDYGQATTNRATWHKSMLEARPKVRSVYGLGLRRVIRLDRMQFAEQPNAEIVAKAFEWLNTEPV